MMNIARIVGLPFRYKPWRPRHARLIASDMLGRAEQPERFASRPSHCRDRLAVPRPGRAQRPAGRRRASAGWSFEDGWLPSYPETSGYHRRDVPSRPAKHSGALTPCRRANRILDWELSIQDPDGAFPGHFGEPGSRPVIFQPGSDHARHAGRMPAAEPGRVPGVRGARWSLAGTPTGRRRLLEKVRTHTACRTPTTRAAPGRCSRPA